MSEGQRTLDELQAEARAKIGRLTPADALAAVDGGGLMIDIRSTDARERDGIVPGSIHVPRTVFEWRLEPAAGLPVAPVPTHDEAAKLPGMGGPDMSVLRGR